MMIEARIECLCPEFDLADIRLKMRRGDVAWIPEGAARGSFDLGIAVRSGAVSVVYSRRCFLIRSPPPPSARMGRIIRSVGRTQATPVVSEPSGRPPTGVSVDPKAIEDAIARGVTRAIADLVSSGVLTTAVAGRVAGPVAAGVTGVDASEPVYIPTNIVPVEKTNIKVSESSSEGTDLEASAAALKATRRRRSTTTEST